MDQQYSSRRNKINFKNKNILITGGTGSFGKQFVKTILKKYFPRKLIIFSRDELKQFEMKQIFHPDKYKCLRYFLGDVRDQERLYEAFHNVDYIIHAAALKQVPTIEYNPFEAIKTNVIGAQNVIRAAIKQKVKKVITLSTDKAANPINLYGASKLCADKLFIAGNAMSGDAGTRFSVVRYGNVVGSRGSVIPFFLLKKETGAIPITDKRMNRFLLTIQCGVDFVIKSLERMFGGEIFVPKIPSVKIIDVAKAIAPDARIEIVGIRPGEKLHEVMIPEDESRNTLAFDDYFIIQPNLNWWKKEEELKESGGKPCTDGFYYCSATNDEWLSVDKIKKLIAEYLSDHKSG